MYLLHLGKVKRLGEELKQQVKANLAKFVGLFFYYCNGNIRFIFTIIKPHIFRIKIFQRHHRGA